MLQDGCLTAAMLHVLELFTPCCVSQHSVKRRLVPRFSQRGVHLLLQFYIQLEIRSVEHGICPIAVFTSP